VYIVHASRLVSSPIHVQRSPSPPPNTLAKKTTVPNSSPKEAHLYDCVEDCGGALASAEEAGSAGRPRGGLQPNGKRPASSRRGDSVEERQRKKAAASVVPEINLDLPPPPLHARSPSPCTVGSSSSSASAVRYGSHVSETSSVAFHY